VVMKGLLKGGPKSRLSFEYTSNELMSQFSHLTMHTSRNFTRFLSEHDWSELLCCPQLCLQPSRQYAAASVATFPAAKHQISA
jgi:hypothetical protein